MDIILYVLYNLYGAKATRRGYTYHRRPGSQSRAYHPVVHIPAAFGGCIGWPTRPGYVAHTLSIHNISFSNFEIEIMWLCLEYIPRIIYGMATMRSSFWSGTFQRWGCTKVASERGMPASAVRYPKKFISCVHPTQWHPILGHVLGVRTKVIFNGIVGMVWHKKWMMPVFVVVQCVRASVCGLSVNFSYLRRKSVY